MSMKNVMKDHASYKEKLITITGKRNGNAIYFDVTLDSVSIDDIFTGISTLATTLHQVTKHEYKDIAVRAITDIIAADPNPNKDSIKDIIKLLKKWNKENLKQNSNPIHVTKVTKTI